MKNKTYKLDLLLGDTAFSKDEDSANTQSLKIILSFLVCGIQLSYSDFYHASSEYVSINITGDFEDIKKALSQSCDKDVAASIFSELEELSEEEIAKCEEVRKGNR